LNQAPTVQVLQQIHDAGFFVEVDDSSRTLNKKVREAQVAQFNFILVVGQQEMDAKVCHAMPCHAIPLLVL
jgi:threonyl-tRNA synthetase